jgi:hypothetical protein
MARKFLIAAIFLSFSWMISVLAQEFYQKIVELTVYNPYDDAKDVKLTMAIPRELTLINTNSTIDVGELAKGEIKNYSLTFSGPEGEYSISGVISGKKKTTGESFAAEVNPLAFAIKPDFGVDAENERIINNTNDSVSEVIAIFFDKNQSRLKESLIGDLKPGEFKAIPAGIPAGASSMIVSGKTADGASFSQTISLKKIEAAETPISKALKFNQEIFQKELSQPPLLNSAAEFLAKQAPFLKTAVGRNSALLAGILAVVFLITGLKVLSLILFLTALVGAVALLILFPIVFNLIILLAILILTVAQIIIIIAGRQNNYH